MEGKKEFQLLDTEDEINYNSNNFTPINRNQNTQQPTQTNSLIKSQNQSNEKAPIKNMSPVAHIMQMSSKQSYGMQTNSQTYAPIRPSAFSNFKISPNDPSANDAKRLELKSLERPRSRSKSRFNSPSSSQLDGIEDYVQQYARGFNATSNKSRYEKYIFAASG